MIKMINIMLCIFWATIKAREKESARGQVSEELQSTPPKVKETVLRINPKISYLHT